MQSGEKNKQFVVLLQPITASMLQLNAPCDDVKHGVSDWIVAIKMLEGMATLHARGVRWNKNA